jgi:hypothetical protein
MADEVMSSGAPKPGEGSSRNAVKRACDACKVRKVRCSNTIPCTCCVAIGIACTFNKNPSTRGPRKLRAKTIQQIVEVQSREASAAEQAASSPRRAVSNAGSVSGAVGGGNATAPGFSQLPPLRASSHPGSVGGTARSILKAPEKPLPPLVASPSAVVGASPPAQNRSPVTPVATLVLQLCLYRLRMFPVWPIVAVEDLMAALQKDSNDLEAYALSNAVGAATAAQLKLPPSRNSGEIVTSESMEAEVQRIRGIMPMKVGSQMLNCPFN